MGVEEESPRCCTGGLTGSEVAKSCEGRSAIGVRTVWNRMKLEQYLQC
jgi:hypothetical protein